MSKTLLDKYVGKTIESLFCEKCNIFITLKLGKNENKCPNCKKENLEFAVIKIQEKRERQETLQEKVDKIIF